MRLSGNRKGQGDPLLFVKKLLCFGEGVWEELRGVVEEEGWGGDVSQPAALWRIQDEQRAEDEGDLAEEDHRCLEIDHPEPTWWDLEHWNEIYDERRCWGDLSRESQRYLRKLLGTG